MEKQEKLKKGQKVAAMAALLTVFLSAAKAGIGVLSGSIVLISDALHSVADLLAVLSSWLGLKTAQRKPTERFPYGYYKAENLATIVVALLILYAAYEIFGKGYQRLVVVSAIKLPLLALGVSFVDAILIYLLGNYEVQVGKKINSQSLTAVGEENRAHLLTSLAVFAGILAAYHRIRFVEGVITIGISLLILKIGLTAAKDSIFALMDVSPSKEVEEKVVEAIETAPGIEEFFDLRLRKAGPFIFGETKVGIRRSIDVSRAHEIADNLERGIKKKVPQVDSFTVHVEPFESDFRHLVIPVKKKRGLDSAVSDHFGRAPYFLFVNLKGKEIKGHYLLENPFKDRPVRAGLAASKLIAAQKSDILVTREIGEISLHTLRDNLIDVYQTRGGTVREVIDRFAGGELEPLKQATRKKT